MDAPDTPLFVKTHDFMLWPIRHMQRVIKNLRQFHTLKLASMAYDFQEAILMANAARGLCGGAFDRDSALASLGEGRQGEAGVAAGRRDGGMKHLSSGSPAAGLSRIAIQEILEPTPQAKRRLTQKQAIQFHLNCEPRHIFEDAIILTDKGVADLARAKSLRHVHVAGAQFTDEALRSLGEIHELESLYIDFSSPSMPWFDPRRDIAITDAGLAHLCQLTKLGNLSIWGVYLSDEGVSHLRELKQLESVGLNWKRVSPAAQAELLDAVSKAAENRLEAEK